MNKSVLLITTTLLLFAVSLSTGCQSSTPEEQAQVEPQKKAEFTGGAVEDPHINATTHDKLIEAAKAQGGISEAEADRIVGSKGEVYKPKKPAGPPGTRYLRWRSTDGKQVIFARFSEGKSTNFGFGSMKMLEASGI
jgi:hypothetical protein